MSCSFFLIMLCKVRSSWFFFFSSRRRHTRCYRDWSSDVCSSDLQQIASAYESSGGGQWNANLSNYSLFERSEEPRLNSSHGSISYAVFCLKKKKKKKSALYKEKKNKKKIDLPKHNLNS